MNIPPDILLDALNGKLPGSDVAHLTSELRALPPASVLSVAAQGGISITGDGNIVGHNNVSIVVKGEGAAELGRVLREAFERGRTLYQLRAPVADFVGRQEEINGLTNALRNGGHASISGISGMGGVGKTELALLVANQLRGDYPDAQLFIEMRGTNEQPLTPADALAACIRPFVGLEAKLPADINELTRLYRGNLSNKRVLVVLDNAANQAQMSPLLPPAGCALLVTSRNAIALPGLMRIALDQLKPNEARHLLLSITPRVRSEMADQICELCGYLPLAVRAAGSLLAVMVDLDPTDYEVQLRDERKRLERIGTEGVEIGLEASFNLSYARLEPEPARVFRQLAVFPASFDAAAEEMVCEDAEHTHLSNLVRRSLVLYDGETKRYRWHDLMRLFASKRLNEEEGKTALSRHAVHYLSVLRKTNEFYLQGEEALKRGLELFDVERDNIQAGQAWAAAQAVEDEAAAALCSNYAYDGAEMIYLRLQPRNRIGWGEAALAAARHLTDKYAESAHLHKLGLAYLDKGEIDRSIEYLEQALAINREIDRREYEAADLGALGLAYAALGEHRKAIKFYRQALAIYRVIDARWGEGIYLSNLGSSYTAISKARLAIKLHEQALKINREVQDRRSEGYTLGNLGAAYAALGEHQRALELFKQNLAIAREMNDRQSEGYALFGSSLSLWEIGDRAEAMVNAETALKVLEEIEDFTTAKVREQLAKWRGRID